MDQHQQFETNFCDTAELASYTRIPPETLRYWRHIGRGPRWFKLGRRVLYDRRDVEEWLAAAREQGAAR